MDSILDKVELRKGNRKMNNKNMGVGWMIDLGTPKCIKSGCDNDVQIAYADADEDADPCIVRACW